jgi:hypothetical protein
MYVLVENKRTKKKNRPQTLCPYRKTLFQTCGTLRNMWNKPNLLTPDNKFVCVINIIISIGNYHQKTGRKKRAIKNPAEAGICQTLSG